MKSSKSEEKRQRIIEAGAHLIHEKGFNNTGLKEIVDAVGIPKGSFYYFFKNKEDFGLHVINHFSSFFSHIASQHISLPGESYLDKLETFFTFFESYFIENNYTGGCPIGNLGQEMGDQNESFATALEQVFQNMNNSILAFLTEAAQRGEIPFENATTEMADYVLNSWEGTLIRVKVQREITPLISWREYTFRELLPRKT